MSESAGEQRIVMFAGVALALALLSVVLFYALSGAEGEGAGDPGVGGGDVPVDGRAGTAPRAPLDCSAELARMRAEADALAPLEPLQNQLQLARGQAERAAGQRLPLPEDGPETRAAFEEVLGGLELEGLIELHCDEYPCVVFLEAEGERAAEIQNALEAAFAEKGLSRYGPPQQPPGVADVRALLFVGPEAPPYRDIVKRLEYRVKRYVSEGPPPSVPDLPEPSAPSRDHVRCGPELATLETTLREHADAKARIEAELAHLQAVQEIAEGRAEPFPEDVPPELSPERAEALADALEERLGHGVAVDCSEFPCMLFGAGPGFDLMKDARLAFDEVAEGTGADVQVAANAFGCVRYGIGLDGESADSRSPESATRLQARMKEMAQSMQGCGVPRD